MKWKHQRLESSKKTGQEQLESQAGDSTDCVLKRRTVLYTATEQDLLSRITAPVWNDVLYSDRAGSAEPDYGGCLERFHMPVLPL
jgi:hypothetical protein